MRFRGLALALAALAGLSGCKRKPSALQLCEALRQAGAARDCRLPDPVPPELAAAAREVALFSLPDAEGEGRVLLLRPGRQVRAVAAGLTWLGAPSRRCFGTDAGRLLVWLPPRATTREAEAALELVRGYASDEENSLQACSDDEGALPDGGR